MSQVTSDLAFVFPGQGSQSVGMLAGLAIDHAEVRETFGLASEILGYDFWRLIQEGPAEQLNSTEFTQPAMLAAGVAAWRVWCKSTPVRPAWLAGHSLGEYTALVCSGALSLADALRLVSARARLMQEAVPPELSGMAAVLGLTDSQVASVCAEASSDADFVSAANFNAPGQVVVAGHRPAVLRAMDLAKGAGAKRAVFLPVSVPSHCPLMEPAAEKFREVLETTLIRTPEIPVLHNVDVAVHAAPEAIRTALERQLSGAVRWADSVVYMAKHGVSRFVECGPGRVLAGLSRRIVAEAKTAAIFDNNSLADAMELAR